VPALADMVELGLHQRAGELDLKAAAEGDFFWMALHYRVEPMQQHFMDTCEPLIHPLLRTTGFYNRCRHIAVPSSHSSGESDGRARGHLHTHSTAADQFLIFPCFVRVIGNQIRINPS
jgi:hypothetical protein